MAAPARQPGETTPEGRIVRVADPVNEEFDLRRLSEVVTPNREFYIRTHGNIPDLDPRRWRLELDGLVERPLSLSLDDLAALGRPREELATLECAGNRRTFQDPAPGGVPWQLGAVSTARFAGVPLAELLRRVGVRPEGQHLHMEGADICPTEDGAVPYARSIPIEVALRPTTLVATMMNGEPLPREHGAPARVVLPSTYAMNSVKWLSRMTVQERPCDGYFQMHDYRLWYGDEEPGEEIGPVRVTSVIAEPERGSTVAAGPVRVHGAAWTGTGMVERVEVSTDGGRTWQEARLVSGAGAGVWRLWEFEWQAVAGDHLLLARASDSNGNEQPLSLPPNRKGYANNVLLPFNVRVR